MNNIKRTDKATDYYNFIHPHRWIKGKPFVHRLGQFQTPGKGTRKNFPYPQVGVIHVPVFDVMIKGVDVSAERMAGYLADPSDKRIGSINSFVDRDSFILSLPFDSVTWNCMNGQTNEISISFEIAGWGDYRDNWNGKDALLKYRMLARALAKGSQLAFGEKWYLYIPPLNKAKLDEKGNCIIPGWIQHREVPFFDGKIWQQPDSHNQVKGQHVDITENFPWNLFFSTVSDELIKIKNDKSFFTTAVTVAGIFF